MPGSIYTSHSGVYTRNMIILLCCCVWPRRHYVIYTRTEQTHCGSTTPLASTSNVRVQAIHSDVTTSLFITRACINAKGDSARLLSQRLWLTSSCLIHCTAASSSDNLSLSSTGSRESFPLLSSSWDDSPLLLARSKEICEPPLSIDEQDAFKSLSLRAQRNCRMAGLAATLIVNSY